MKTTDDKTNEWKTYRTRFLVRAKQLNEHLTFTDTLGREHRGEPGDYLVESSDGTTRVAPKAIFEDIYVVIPSAYQSRKSTINPEIAAARNEDACIQRDCVGTAALRLSSRASTAASTPVEKQDGRDASGQLILSDTTCSDRLLTGTIYGSTVWHPSSEIASDKQRW